MGAPQEIIAQRCLGVYGREFALAAIPPRDVPSPSERCERPVGLAGIDWAIMLLYFASVLGIGAVLKRYVKTSTDFFLAGRSIPAWICGLAFLSANLGAQEVIGMAASGAKHGIATSHFYWIGAIPAKLFLGQF